jgi:hypothetical protein
MRRWFIIVFILQFVLNMAAFATGHIDIRASLGEQMRTDAVLIGNGHDSAQKDDLLGAAPDHGLTDSQPDLPEFITPVAFPTHAPPTGAVPADVCWVSRPSPTLEGPQRPPRAQGIHA